MKYAFFFQDIRAGHQIVDKSLSNILVQLIDFKARVSSYNKIDFLLIKFKLLLKFFFIELDL